jgi:lysophospholipase L1-like esterase
VAQVPPDPNRIDDRDHVLDGVYAKLAELRRAPHGQVTVFHLGDSHVQAGFFADVMRAEFSRAFGDAGHGLVMPRVRARVRSSRGRVTTRLLTLDEPRAVADLEFRVTLADDDPSEGFDRLTFVHEKGPANLDFVVTDEAHRVLADVPSLAAMPSTGVTTVSLPGTCRAVLVKTSRSAQTQKFAQLYGISLERQTPGVRVDSFGIVGATAETMVRSPALSTLLSAVRPDLVIVSLGTNDATARPFRDEVFSAQVADLVARVRGACPRAAVLLTTPPDSFLRATRRTRAAPNPAVVEVRRVLIESAATLRCASWDLFDVMGGSGAIGAWRDEGLARGDLIHFTKPGYEWQAHRFFAAFYDSFTRYAGNRPG